MDDTGGLRVFPNRNYKGMDRYDWPLVIRVKAMMPMKTTDLFSIEHHVYEPYSKYKFGADCQDFLFLFARREALGPDYPDQYRYFGLVKGFKGDPACMTFASEFNDVEIIVNYGEEQ